MGRLAWLPWVDMKALGGVLLAHGASILLVLGPEPIRRMNRWQIPILL
jgi:hypothetical protein